MEWKKSIQVFSLTFIWLLITLSQISAFPQSSATLGEDYEQQQPGLKEMLDELERQGGLSGRMIPRNYYVAPNHKMARKSQRSNTLRLRFGKRSEIEDRSSVMSGESPLTWKMTEFGNALV